MREEGGGSKGAVRQKELMQENMIEEVNPVLLKDPRTVGAQNTEAEAKARIPARSRDTDKR
jgi:hypothetical protein